MVNYVRCGHGHGLSLINYSPDAFLEEIFIVKIMSTTCYVDDFVSLYIEWDFSRTN